MIIAVIIVIIIVIIIINIIIIVISSNMKNFLTLSRLMIKWADKKDEYLAFHVLIRENIYDF